MRSRALSLCAALLLLGLMPGSTLAATQPQFQVLEDNIDQSNTCCGFSSTSVGATTGLAQTFTAGRSGFLDKVRLWMVGDGTVIARIEALSGGLPDGTPLGSASAALNGIPVTFYFSEPLTIRAGAQYAIVVEPSAQIAAYDYSADSYAGGQALVGNDPWVPMAQSADLAFITYVSETRTRLAWDKASSTAGEATPLTLTATMWYSDDGEKAHYTRVRVPDWYSVAGINCPASVPAASCTIQALEDGITFPVADAREPQQFTLTGTAAPPISEDGSVWPWGEATVEACFNGPRDSSCNGVRGTIRVLAATSTSAPSLAATLPPTAARAEFPQRDSDGTIWLFPIAAVVLFGALVAFQTRRRRISNSPFNRG